MNDVLTFLTGAAFGMFATAGSLAYRVLTRAQAGRAAK